MLLQTLVENAVKHGISQIRGAGRIEIRARVEDDTLILEVTDSGPGLRPDRPGVRPRARASACAASAIASAATSASAPPSSWSATMPAGSRLRAFRCRSSTDTAREGAVAKEPA